MAFLMISVHEKQFSYFAILLVMGSDSRGSLARIRLGRLSGVHLLNHQATDGFHFILTEPFELFILYRLISDVL